MAGGAGETFLGLDIGTSSVKALLIDADQKTVADASVPLSLSRPQPLWSEQNADDWVAAVNAAVAVLRASAPGAFARLAGIGLSGQMHGATFVDAAGKPLRPAILWNDVRSFAECAEMEKSRSRPATPRRQHRHAWLHSAEGLVGGQTRARGLQGDQAHPAAEGLCAVQADRRGGVGNVGRLRHAVARRR